MPSDDGERRLFGSKDGTQRGRQREEEREGSRYDLKVSCRCFKKKKRKVEKPNILRHERGRIAGTRKGRINTPSTAG